MQLNRVYIGSTLADTLYQLGMRQSGVMSMILSGKHCNRCQTLHKTFAIAIERLYLQKTCEKMIMKTMLKKSVL